MSDRQRPASRDAYEHAAAHAAARYSELRTLAERHRAGHVSDREFRRGKRRILATAGDEYLAIARLELFIARYHDERAAENALDHLRQRQDEDDLLIIGAAAVVRDSAGHLHALEMRDLSGMADLPASGGQDDSGNGRETALRFSSTLVPALHGWSTGHFRSDELRSIGEDLCAGQSAIIAVVQRLNAEPIAIGMREYETIARHARSAELTRVVALVDQPDGEDTNEERM